MSSGKQGSAAPLAPRVFPKRTLLSGPQAEDRGTKRTRTTEDEETYRPAFGPLEDTKEILEDAQESVVLYLELENKKKHLLTRAKTDPSVRAILVPFFDRSCPALRKILFPEVDAPEKDLSPPKRKLPEGKKKTLKSLKEKLTFLLKLDPEIEFKMERFEEEEKKIRRRWEERKDKEVGEMLEALVLRVENLTPKRQEELEKS